MGLESDAGPTMAGRDHKGRTLGGNKLPGVQIWMQQVVTRSHTIIFFCFAAGLKVGGQSDDGWVHGYRRLGAHSLVQELGLTVRNGVQVPSRENRSREQAGLE